MKEMRKIIHVDMDAFYASIEQRDHPEYRNKPLIISGPPQSRSVVSTCSYEARKFGIHSAMPSSHAYRLCPHGIFIPPEISKYKRVSSIIHSVFRSYTDLVEPLSLDEAYLDVTNSPKNEPSATTLAREIKKEITEKTGLTASAGVSYNKFLAKIASDIQKPDGLTVITPQRAIGFLESLPIGKFFGIGKKTQARMKEEGIHTGADLKKWKLYELLNILGKTGSFYYYAVRGIDNRPVISEYERKSYGKEHTFSKDLIRKRDIAEKLHQICLELSRGLEHHNIKGRCVTVKVKFNDFKQVTRSYTPPHSIYKCDELYSIGLNLLKKTDAGMRPLRLLGVSLSQLDNNNVGKDSKQMTLDLFDEDL